MTNGELPIPRPPTFRDFYSFEGHMLNARLKNNRPIPNEWYHDPVFYYSNPYSLVGDGAEIQIPRFCEEMDYELEVGAVIKEDCINVGVWEAWEYVAGFIIINDFSARDLQRRETAVGLGPAKGKDFATAIGPRFVPMEEIKDKIVGDCLSLEMSASVNGRTLSQGNTSRMFWRFPQLIKYASVDCRLLKGDLIGSGTCENGCIFELGPENTDGWLKPGDVVSLTVERLGTLNNTIIARRPT